MIKHLLSGALLLAMVAACTSEPVTDKDTGGGTPPDAANEVAADEGAGKQSEAPKSPAERLKLTYFNVDG